MSLLTFGGINSSKPLIFENFLKFTIFNIIDDTAIIIPIDSILQAFFDLAVDVFVSLKIKLVALQHDTLLGVALWISLNAQICASAS